MKVKSFVMGLAGGIDSAVKGLDQGVNELGDIHIHSVTDTFYSENQIGDVPGPRMVRVVVYTPKQ